MNAPQYTQDNLRITITSPFGPNQLLFKTLQGEETLSKPFQFTVEMLSQADDLAFQTIVGKNLGITIQFPEDNQRYLNGMVTRFIQAGRDARFTVYQAEMRPWLWALTLTRNCRIFQHLSVPDIIKKVFNDLGFTDYRLRLIYSYPPRDYCVQYEETAFNFVCRLMEDEGIFYFFEHQADKHILVLADDLGAHQPCPGIDTARFCQSPNETNPEDIITHCQWFQQLVSGQYAVDDFNFELPSTDLKTAVKGPCGPFRIYEYAAGFSKRDQGESKVRRRIEAHELPYQLLSGQGHCFSFTSGYQFQLLEHRRADLNQSYVLRWVAHDLSLEHYSNAFDAFAVTVPFRPPMVTPKPKIVSTQTAIVTGPEGEEIWTDNYGRIKVQFHWDQEGQYDDNSSCWIRVNQGWAGKGWGHIGLPRIGQEVIVSFLNGDPDRPLVTGAVYNAQQVLPYPLPTEQTKSTLKSNSSKGGQGFNEIRLEDKKGQEQLFIHAEKNQDIRVKNDTYESIGANRHLSVGSSQFEQVAADKHLAVSGDQFERIQGDCNLTVNGDQLEAISHTHHLTLTDQLAHLKGSRHVTIGNADNLKVGGQLSITAGSIHQKTGNYGLNTEVIDLSGSGNVKITSGATLTLQVGPSFITLSASGIDISGPIININSGGTPGGGGQCAPTAPAAPESPTAPKAPSPADGAGSGTKSVDEYSVVAEDAPPPNAASAATTAAANPTAAALTQAAQVGMPLCTACPAS